MRERVLPILCPTPPPRTWAGAIVIASMVASGALATAQVTGAEELSEAMLASVMAQKTIMRAFNADIEANTPELQEVQFASSGELLHGSMRRTSAAGVTRRKARQAAPATAGSARGRAAAAYGPNCVQAVDLYGRVYAKCY